MLVNVLHSLAVAQLYSDVVQRYVRYDLFILHGMDVAGAYL